MKKIIIIVLGIAVIIGLTFLAIDLSQKSKSTNNKLIAFSIKDTAAVDKISIYNSFNDKEYTITRNENNVWVGPNNTCVRQEIPKMMLTTMKKITLQGYVPKSAMANMKKLLMAQYKRVKIYKNGDWVKTWFVGQSTKDHMGTYMLLETPNIKSDYPVIMGMKGFYGILGPRFIADARKFTCTNLFSFPRSNIKKVSVINRITPSRSFQLTVDSSNNYHLTSQGEEITGYHPDNITFYLNGFQNIHFNQPNYTLSKADIDSIKSLPPSYELEVKGKESSYHLDLYIRPSPDQKQVKDSIIWDKNYLWAKKEDGKIVRMQYYVMGPLLQGKTIMMGGDAPSAFKK